MKAMEKTYESYEKPEIARFPAPGEEGKIAESWIES
jgi:hypothetical protein